MANLSKLNIAPRLALGLACSISSLTCSFSGLGCALPVCAQTAVSAPVAAVKDQPRPQGALTNYANDLKLPGWEPQPYYIWLQGSAPATSISAASVLAPASAMPTPSSTMPSPAVEAAAPSATAMLYPGPKLPDGDGFKEAILGEYRLTAFFRKTFKRGQRYIYIDVFEFKDVDGAYGAYNYLRKGSTTVLPRGDAASEDEDSISIVQGKTFLSIYGTSHDDDESKEVLTKVASQAVKYIADKGSQSAILNRLPQMDLLHGSEKIVMGPNSARRFFPAPYVNSLDLGNGRAVGCVADYQMQEPAKERLKLMVLAYKTPGDAAASYKNFLTDLGVARNDDVSALVNQPINVFKTGKSYLAIEQKGADLLMVIGARKRFSPAMVMHQVR